MSKYINNSFNIIYYFKYIFKKLDGLRMVLPNLCKVPIIILINNYTSIPLEDFQPIEISEDYKII